jgi:hypothetical protein
MCAIYETHGDLRLSDHLLTGIDQLIPNWFNDEDISTMEGLFSSIDRMESPHSVIPTWTAALSEMNLLALSHVIDKCRSKHATIFKLMYRVGFEVGRFLRLLHTKPEISWGSYDDKLVRIALPHTENNFIYTSLSTLIQGFHCNAHPNNLIVLSKRDATANSLLAPLDFDLAYQRNEFTGHTQRWHELLTLEVQAMRLALGGLNNLNSGVADVANLEARFDPVRWTLRYLNIIETHH